MAKEITFSKLQLIKLNTMLKYMEIAKKQNDILIIGDNDLIYCTYVLDIKLLKTKVRLDYNCPYNGKKEFDYINNKEVTKLFKYAMKNDSDFKRWVVKNSKNLGFN